MSETVSINERMGGYVVREYLVNQVKLAQNTKSRQAAIGVWEQFERGDLEAVRVLENITGTGGSGISRSDDVVREHLVYQVRLALNTKGRETAIANWERFERDVFRGDTEALQARIRQEIDR